MKRELSSRGAGESRLDFAYRVSNAARDAELQKLQVLRDEFRLRAAFQTGSTMKSVEWGKLPTMTRVVFLLMAGVDGESETLAVRAWNEFSPPEQAAVESSMRQLRSALVGAQALCRS